MRTIVFAILAVTLVLIVVTKPAYKVPVWKLLILTFYADAVGYFGCKVMSWIENGAWGGELFYGAVLFTPIFILPIMCLLKLKFAAVMDLIAGTGMMAQCIMKIDCYYKGCCSGMIIGYHMGQASYFPSQIVEGVVACIHAIVVYYAVHKGYFKGNMYYVSVGIYAVERIILQSFRIDNSVFLFGLNGAYLWSLVSFIICSTLLFSSYNRNLRKKYMEKLDI